MGARSLKKGETLIEEGEHSLNMYWLQSGSLRLYKRKGRGFIELGVVKSGEIVGEMSFLDKKSRSASVTALESSQVVEIPRGKFEEIIQEQPKWMISLIATLVKRLRNSNNELQEAKNASLVYVNEESGKTKTYYEFITMNTLLRILTILLLGSKVYEENSTEGKTKGMPFSILRMYGNHIMGIPEVKINAALEMMREAKVLAMEKKEENPLIHIFNTDLIKRFIHWQYEQNIATKDNQVNLSENGHRICKCIYDYGELNTFGNKEVGILDMQAIYETAAKKTENKTPFDFRSFNELVKSGFAQELRIVSNTKKTTEFQVKKFQALYPCLHLQQKLYLFNNKKGRG